MPTARSIPPTSASSLPPVIPLAAMLRRQHRRWAAAGDRCRRDFSKRSVHEVRVQGRRLLALLELVRIILPPGQVDAVAATIKSGIRQFGRLRDVQIQRQLVKSLAGGRRDLEPLSQHLKKRESRLLKRLERATEDFDHEAVDREIKDLVRALKRTASDREQASRQPRLVLAAVTAAFCWVRSLQRRVDVQRPETLHRVRIAFKRFRYMVESLLKEAPLISRDRVVAMRKFQTRMGDVQDLEILLRRIGKFIAKHPEQADAMARIEQRVQARRARLVARHVQAAGELDRFWPVPAGRLVPATTARLRRATGLLPQHL